MALMRSRHRRLAAANQHTDDQTHAGGDADRIYCFNTLEYVMKPFSKEIIADKLRAEGRI